MKCFFAFLVLSISLTASEYPWIRQQVNEDLADVPHRSFHSRDIRNLFGAMDKQGHQVLYYSIKNNQLVLRSSARQDGFRMPHIHNYLLGLAQRRKLPDTEFIIRYDDGVITPSPLPIFSFSKHRDAKNVCLFPDFEMLWELASRERSLLPVCQKLSALHPWKTKQPVGFFRGMSTGRWDPSLPDFGNDRVRLTIFSYQHPSLVDATISALWQSDLREYLASIGKEVTSASMETHFQYKYLFDVDGNASTYSRCRWILLSNSVLLKMMSGYSQWYYKALQPYVNFVPIKSDLSDLIDILKFLKTHDKEAHQIADDGTSLGNRIFSYDAVDQYVVTLLKEYSKRMRSKKSKHPRHQKGSNIGGRIY
ncbi:MAG TPA: glycosyl transferase family 90 [Chlamydiales bacterium]|nr:glycosyl transferase family 90 [Chlamydiales bacterium]